MNLFQSTASARAKKMSKCPSQYLDENLITIVPGLKLRKNDDIFSNDIKNVNICKNF